MRCMEAFDDIKQSVRQSSDKKGFSVEKLSERKFSKRMNMLGWVGLECLMMCVHSCSKMDLVVCLASDVVQSLVVWILLFNQSVVCLT